MNSLKNIVKIGGSIFSVLMLTARLSSAQDPVEVAPDNYKTLVDNEHVRVLDVHIAPGITVAMHAHPDTVVYHVGPSKEKHTFGDGTVAEREFKGGEAELIPAFTHSAENTGSSEIHVLLVELKEAAKAAAPAATNAPAAKDPVAVAPASYTVALDNDRVRVLDVKLASGVVVPMHAHPACVVYHLTPSSERHTFGDGRVEVRDFKGGEAAYMPAFSHMAENVSETGIEVLVVELK